VRAKVRSTWCAVPVGKGVGSMEAILRRLLPDGKFINVSPGRTRAMRAVRGKGNRSTELRLRLALVRAGICGWSMHPPLVGKPDFLLRNGTLAVFVDGCYWHGCTKCGHIPKSNVQFWTAKIELNRARDQRTNRRLRKMGIGVLRLWEHELLNDTEKCVKRVMRRLFAKPRAGSRIPQQL
jgi:DNA mismatch endonuclease (patch repair protein)